MKHWMKRWSKHGQTRVQALSLAVLALSASAAFAANPPSRTAEVMEFVRSLYTTHPMEEPNRFFAPVILALMAEDAMVTPQDDTGALDADPFCACQDDEGLKTQIVVRTATADNAAVDVMLRFGGKVVPGQEKVSLTLVRLNEGWRIADISSRMIPSLQKLYRDHIAQQRKLKR